MTDPRRPPEKPSEFTEKPSGRGRPPRIDWQALLGVAREVFLESGVRATTLEVAKRAGVSEGALFRRFKSKEGLFGAAMDFDQEDAPKRLLNAVLDLEGLELQEALVKLSNTLLDVGRVALPIMMMSWSNPHFCGSMPSEKQARFRAFLKAFGSFLERRMDEGKLRRMDSEVLARALIGSIHHYCMTRIMLEEADQTVIPEGMFVRGLVDLFLNGAAMPSERAHQSSARHAPPQNRRTRSG